MKSIREWIMGGLAAFFATVCAYLAIHQITSYDTSIATLTTSIGSTNDAITKLTNELGANKTDVAVLNNAGQQLRDDISHTRTTVDAVALDLAFVKGQLSNVQAQLKLVTPAPK